MFCDNLRWPTLSHLLVSLVLLLVYAGSWNQSLATDDNRNDQLLHSVDAKKCLVWGPGLKSDVVLPARYFMIQLVDKNGQNITDSVGERPFEVSIKKPGVRTRVWIRTTDRNDGSYVIQYKLYHTVDELTIQVILNGVDVGESPYTLQGPVYHEKCNCPNPSLDGWMDAMGCDRYTYTQIENDLKLFPKVDMTIVEKEVVQRFNLKGAHSLCHYVVKDNKVYRKTYGEHVGFKMFMDAMLLSLTRKVLLPDFEFFVNLGDWPLVKHKVPGPQPVFSWCGSDDTYDIVMPTYDVTESTLETLGRCDRSNQSMEMPTYDAPEEKLKNSCRVSLDLVSVQGAKAPKWNEKSSLAFWRGRDSRQERLDLVRMSLKHPDIIDARLTNMFFFKKEDGLGDLVKHISFFDFFKYKYQINIDGTVAAYRFPYLLGGDSLVLKQDSSYYEYFYHLVKPFEHYIPFKRDLSNLLEVIQWAKDNDDQAQKIAENARQFVRDNLMAENIYCYHAVLFKEYAKRLVSPVKVQDDMELVEQPNDSDSKCECHRAKVKPKEEL